MEIILFLIISLLFLLLSMAILAIAWGIFKKDNYLLDGDRPVVVETFDKKKYYGWARKNELALLSKKFSNQGVISIRGMKTNRVPLREVSKVREINNILLVSLLKRSK